VQNNYGFEGHINVGWGPHLALGLPVRQPRKMSFTETHPTAQQDVRKSKI